MTSSNNPTVDEELDLLVTLFETGKELSRQYQQYDGDKDWVEWLRDVLPRADVYSLLHDYRTAAQTELLDELELKYKLSRHNEIPVAVWAFIQSHRTKLTKGETHEN